MSLFFASKSLITTGSVENLTNLLAQQPFIQYVRTELSPKLYPSKLFFLTDNQYGRSKTTIG
jgi:hypothetical protein